MTRFGSDREIWLSFTTDKAARIAVILHELRHAWERHVGVPRDAETECQLTASIGEQFRQDIDANGGDDCIMRLRAEPWPYTREEDDQPTKQLRRPTKNDRHYEPQEYRSCPRCEASMAAGSIEHGIIEFYAPTKEYQIDRWMICETCGTLSTWREICTPDGQPLGRIVEIPRPRMLNGAEASEWLKRRAVACER
ncbi:MAG: hypothetical protein JO353_02175 [Phycisphaerae bacterium]|nr:hypothetical protein [Phycisphaerae bacterium]